MEASNAKIFSNEHALDWLTDLLDEQDVYFIHNTLEIIADYPGEERPDTWDCHCALAAAEMVAAARGNPPADLPLVARKWLEKYQLEADEELMTLAQKAVERIESNSELKLLWDESPQGADWYLALSELRQRLGLPSV
jgi:hypothetical protein